MSGDWSGTCARCSCVIVAKNTDHLERLKVRCLNCRAHYIEMRPKEDPATPKGFSLFGWTFAIFRSFR